MAKFYVQSGTLQMVTDADDERGAALWAVHASMLQVLPICPDDPLSPEEKSEHIAQRGCYVLGPTVSTSELGFDRKDATVHETADLFVEWNQLMIAMTRLQRQLDSMVEDAPVASSLS